MSMETGVVYMGTGVVYMGTGVVYMGTGVVYVGSHSVFLSFLTSQSKNIFAVVELASEARSQRGVR